MDEMKRSNQDYANEQRVTRTIVANRTNKKVLISELWFKVDGYGAAVAGILKSVELGLASPSVGEGTEYEVLVSVKELLLKLDKGLQVD